jgi:hypothetical protein
MPRRTRGRAWFARGARVLRVRCRAASQIRIWSTDRQEGRRGVANLAGEDGKLGRK